MFAPATTFDYRKALAHQGGLGSHGWDQLEHLGASDASLCAYVWELSDVLSVASAQRAPETGWLVSMANRYGRPVICTAWSPGDATIVEETLRLFSAHHVRWYSTGRNSTSAGFEAAPPQNAAEAPSLLQALGVLDPRVLAENENLSRLLKQFRYQRVMTPRQ